MHDYLTRHPLEYSIHITKIETKKKKMKGGTSTKPNNTPTQPTTLNPPGLLFKLLDGVKRTSDLERADALLVLAFEPQPENGLCLLSRR